MKSTYFLAICFLIPGLAFAQDYPDIIIRGAATQTQVNTEYAFLVDRDVKQNQVPLVNQVIQSNGLEIVTQKDSLTKFSTYPKGRWLKRKTGVKLTSAEWKTIQNSFPAGAFLTPAYTIGLPSLKTTFAPVPNLLVVDSAILNNSLLRQGMTNAGLVYEPGKSKYLFGFAVFKVKRGNNTIFIRESLLQNGFGIAGLQAFLNFENLPLLNMKMSSSGDGAGASNEDEPVPVYDDWNLRKIHALPSRNHNNSSVLVGVIDSGCETHPELNLEPGINFSTVGLGPTLPGTLFPPLSNPHGTKVAGVIGAKMDGVGTTGVAPNARILPVAQETSLTDVELANSIGYCVHHHADIINMSFGQQPDVAPSPDASVWYFYLIDPTIEFAYKKGILMVAASGNDEPNGIDYPARHPLVMAVGASTRRDTRWSGSQFGDIVYKKLTGVSVVAPGDTVWTTTTGSDYNWFHGTSAAAPHVSGLAALLKSTYSTLTNRDLRSIIELSAEKIDKPHLTYSIMPGFPNGLRNVEVGYGRINVENALKIATWFVGRPTAKFISGFRFKESSKGSSIPFKKNSLLVEVENDLPSWVPVKVIVLPEGAKVGFSSGAFTAENGVVLGNVNSANDTIQPLREFYFDPKDLEGITNSEKKWEAIVVADQSFGQLNLADVRSVLLEGRTDVKSLAFTFDDESPYVGPLIFGISAILLAIFLVWRRRRKDQKLKAQSQEGQKQ